MKYPEHTSTQFDAELTAVCANVLQMGEAVENQFRLALDSLVTGDLTMIDRVMNAGRAIDAMEIDIDENCTRIFVRRQPTANDLRLVKTIIKIINDLKHIDDEAESIACMSKLIAQKRSSHLPGYQQIKYIADVALGMLSASLATFDAMDADSARKVGRKDALIDAELDSILRHLVGYMMEDAADLPTALQTLCVAKSIKRIGDHTKNISKHVVYMMEGR
ncbi:MAG: phosphate transport system [Gallionellaceae bacterium]|nr:MAG: phosphate transport system [Gallionellaceae bacterium]